MKNKLKTVTALLVLAVLAFVQTGCAVSEKRVLEMKDIDITELKTMMDDAQSFTLVVERDECAFCKAMNDYLDTTKEEHPADYNVYRLNTTDYELYRETEGDMTLISSTEAGRDFLSLFPYFLYTPAIYQIQDGRPVDAGIGYDESRHTVSEWSTDSTIDWNQARPVDVWDFLAGDIEAPSGADSQS